MRDGALSDAGYGRVPKAGILLIRQAQDDSNRPWLSFEPTVLRSMALRLSGLNVIVLLWGFAIVTHSSPSFLSIMAPSLLFRLGGRRNEVKPA
jgi:hypothetical protein